MSTNSTTPSTPYVRVAVGVILNSNDEVLLSSRPADKPWPYWWELAGGKIERNESVDQALRRELQEEIGITATAVQPWVRLIHHYPHNTVELNFCQVTAWDGEPTPLEGQQLAWYQPTSVLPLAIGPVLPATFPVLRWLQLPKRYLISQIGSPAGLQPWLHQLQHALANGVQLVQLREPAWAGTKNELFAALQQTVQLCRQYGARCLLNSVHSMQWLAYTDGLHLRSVDGNQPLPALAPQQLLAMSTHNENDVQQAAALGCDFVVIGHVLPTPSHPDEPALGWARFAELAALAGRPAFAIGGQSMHTFAASQQYGAHGIAGIRNIG